MPYKIYIDEAGPWLVTEFDGVIGGAQLVAARKEAAALNQDSSLTDIILDFTDVRQFVLEPSDASQIQEVDAVRASALPNGRCALVVQHPLVEIGTTFLGAISALNLDFRILSSRADAEAWLRGTLGYEPPAIPRRGR